MRIAVIGNSGGGKSVLGSRLASELHLPCVEVDAYLWLMAEARCWTSLPGRLQRTTHIVLVDMPLWVHFWLAAERHIAWSAGRLEHLPAGSTEPAPLRGLFRTIAEVDRDWMPELRKLVQAEEHVVSVSSVFDPMTRSLVFPPSSFRLHNIGTQR